MKPPRYDLLDSNDWPEPEPSRDKLTWGQCAALILAWTFVIGVPLLYLVVF